MSEDEVRRLLDDVRAGRLSRRESSRPWLPWALPRRSRASCSRDVAVTSFYSSDPANPDTYTHFYSDLQLATYVMGPPDPALLMRVFISDAVATRENKWQRFNVWRWRNEEYDRLYKAAETEMGPVKRAALFIRMNDLVVQSGIVVPIVLRTKAAAMSTRLCGIEHNVYEVDFWNLAFWSREA
jgi:peptide/nickel transport system substrate-binding protein